MVHAFVMVKTAVGGAESLVDNVRELASVAEAHIVAGEYDLIAEVDVGEVYDVQDTTVSEMQALDDVEATKTYISLGE
ncbi:MAG: transcriptional regulator [Halonotius sp. J07HN6]|jgi:transcriptional regulator, AsnC family|nr:MAG: transcriptional regulator [Halonotius sp. J07HN6]ESS08353.1 MAG: transcriptional regulator, AsnC family [uncultured archaeon A07HN63]